jgi:hypothetical protein
MSVPSVKFILSRSAVHEEVQNVHSGIRLPAVKLSIAAVGAAYGAEALILYVEQLCKVAARGLKLIRVIGGAAAFGASVLDIVHIVVPFIHLPYLSIIIIYFALQHNRKHEV